MAGAIGKAPAVIKQLVMMFGVNQLDDQQRTPLMFAALGNNKDSSCNTLIACAADVDMQDASGLTALHVSCYHGNKSAAAALLANKANIAIRDNLVGLSMSKKVMIKLIIIIIKGHTALHWSMVPKDTGCSQLLLR